ncbi:angiogenic factor with G patch and FHA domains 1-like isoform X2 [Pararge aegeria]|uniref:angiogenic factor with G patch and FHA domains 1-like isoform X2 n=1 Tax=Pararge aegeria TaxID=116150 RepID=UPI0019D1F6FB|nr:angiogenic factor with G patch and FHA domains 1-like isoform X2 [Pararge aegeria]
MDKFTSLFTKRADTQRMGRRFTLRSLRLSLKYRPEILKLVLKMRQTIKMKNALLSKLARQLKNNLASTYPSCTQTELDPPQIQDRINLLQGTVDPKLCDKNSTHTQTPLEETVDFSLTGRKEYLCDKNNSYTQTTLEETANKEEKFTQDSCTQTASPDVKENAKTDSNEVTSTAWDIQSGEKTKSIAEQVKEVAQSALQQTGMVYVETAGMYYDYKTGYYYNSELGLYYHTDTGCYYYYSDEKQTFVFHSYPQDNSSTNKEPYKSKEVKKATKQKKKQPSDDIANLTKQLNQVSLRGSMALESVARNHPPCMRIIVRETSLEKLKVGSLYLITKDGGTIGREGDHHALVLRDHNVSRNHLHLKYDMDERRYLAVDLGSKNGTLLNGVRMSESQSTSVPNEVVHGSTIQLGETKLLCHIHAGNDTCGHCEPGLIMGTQEKEKQVAYTRTCSVQKQHQLELARLKNKYAPKRLAIEETAYNDRAQTRREKVGSSHHSEKTQSTDINTFIEPENKGFKLLEKMGWSKGEGLGKDSQGDREPIPMVSNEGKTGLGSTSEPKVMVSKTLGPATLRLAAKTKMLQPPAKAFQQAEEDSE